MKKIVAMLIAGSLLASFSASAAELTASALAKITYTSYGTEGQATRIGASDSNVGTEGNKDDGRTARAGLDLRLAAEGEGWIAVAETYSRDNGLSDLDSVYATVRFEAGDLTFGKKDSIADDYAVRSAIVTDERISGDENSGDEGIGDAAMAINDATIYLDMPSGFSIGVDLNNQEGNASRAFDTEVEEDGNITASGPSLDIAAKYVSPGENFDYVISLGSYSQRGSVYGLGVTYRHDATKTFYFSYAQVSLDEENYSYSVPSSSNTSANPKNGTTGTVMSVGVDYVAGNAGLGVQYAARSGEAFEVMDDDGKEVEIVPSLAAKLYYKDGPITYAVEQNTVEGSTTENRSDTTLSMSLAF